MAPGGKHDLRKRGASTASDAAAISSATEGYSPLCIPVATPGWAQGIFTKISQDHEALWKAISALEQKLQQMQGKESTEDVVARQQTLEIVQEVAAVKLEVQTVHELQQVSLEYIGAQEKLAARRELDSACTWVFNISVTANQLCDLLNKVIKNKQADIPADPSTNIVVTRVDSIKNNRCRVWFWSTRAAKAAHKVQLSEQKVYWANVALEREDNSQLKQINCTIARANAQELQDVQFTWRRGRLVVSQGQQRGYYPLYKHKSSLHGMLAVGGVVGLDGPKAISEAIAFAFAHHPCELAQHVFSPSTPTAMGVSVPMSVPGKLDELSEFVTMCREEKAKRAEFRSAFEKSSAEVNQQFATASMMVHAS